MITHEEMVKALESLYYLKGVFETVELDEGCYEVAQQHFDRIEDLLNKGVGLTDGEDEE